MATPSSSPGTRMLRRISLPASSAAVALALFTARVPAADVSQATADQIRMEATRPNDDPLGHALPLAAHWNTGTHPPDDTFDPEYQLQLIAQGHQVLPFLSMPSPGPLPKKLAIPKAQRAWWSNLLEKLNCDLPPFNCNSVGFKA